MSPSIDILVHVSGPSRGVDDTRYRREALGFLDFNSAFGNRVIPIIHQRSTQDEGGYTSSQRNNGTQDSDSLQTSQRIANIRRLFHQKVQEATPARADANTGQVRIPSLPWTSIKKTPHLQIERTPALPRPRTAPYAATPSTTARPLRRTQSDSWQTPPSVIPNSQPSQEHTRDGIASSPILKRPFQSSSPSQNKDSSPTSKRVRRGSMMIPTATTADTSTGRPSSQTAKPHGSSASQARPPPPDRWADLPSEIHSPRPSPGIRRFVSHLSYFLRTLSDERKLRPLITMQTPARTVDKHERGHWLIPLRTWDDREKCAFWSYLMGFVGKGNAGWFIDCYRELVDRSKPDSTNKENQSPSQEEIIKIYCWGEIAKELYVGLFLGAKYALRRGGAQWVDAGGNAVIRMNQKRNCT